MKIQIYVCGEGIGHTSRCLAVARRLTDVGHEVSFHAYGQSKKHVEKNGFKAVEIPSEIHLVGKAGSLDIKETMKASVKNMKPLGLPKILNHVRRGRPDVVLSDSYFLAVVAAKLRGVPAYLMLNQTNTYRFFENRGVKAEVAGDFMRRFMDLIFNNVKRVIIPDFPPPWTICKNNVEELGEVLFYSGPLVMKKPVDVKPLKLKKPHILSLVGGFGYREKILFKLIEVAEINKKINYTLLTGPSVDARKLANHPRNVNVVDYLPDITPYLKAVDLVVAPGGHSTMMEALTYGLPLISFPDMNHGEQEGNADQLQELNLGRRLSYHTPPFMISDVINELLADRQVHRNLRKLKEYSRRLDGPRRVVELVENAI